MNNDANAADQQQNGDYPAQPVATTADTVKSASAARAPSRTPNTRGAGYRSGGKALPAAPSSEQTSRDEVNAVPSDSSAAVQAGIARQAAEHAAVPTPEAERKDDATESRGVEESGDSRAEVGTAAAVGDASPPNLPAHAGPNGETWTYGMNMKRRKD